MDTFDEVFEFINKKVDSLVPEDSGNAFLALGAEKDNISASYAGKRKHLTAMLVAHMLHDERIRLLVFDAAIFYAERQEELMNLEEDKN